MNDPAASAKEFQKHPPMPASAGGKTPAVIQGGGLSGLRNKPTRRIGDLLIETGKIDTQQLGRALAEAKATGQPVGTVLVRLGYIDERTLGQTLAVLHGLEYVEASAITLNPAVMNLLPNRFVQKNLVVPIALDATHRRLEVVMVHPDDVKLLDEISLLTGYRVLPKVSTYGEISDLLHRFFVQRASSEDAMAKLEENLSQEDNIFEDGYTTELEAELEADDAPVVQLVNAILMEAVESNASDVHMEPQQERLLVRFRIDGILQEVKSIPKQMAAALTSRIKVVSGMDIAERRRPQDGRMKIRAGSGDVDMRVNCIATQFGEKVVIRLLRSSVATGNIDKIGLGDNQLKRFKRMLKSPHGIILATGPTGSGKTTTLYASLRAINSPDTNIITIEDPIEFPLAGINQTQVMPKANLTFAMCLRAILRQDPDVIMVGEIRDSETLDAAIHAALTGHLVFSTLHTNSAAKTIARLQEMGAPNYLISSSLRGIVAQRLVRRICPRCKSPETPTEETLEILGLQHTDSSVTLYKGTGCEFCKGTGYMGRVGLYEMMPISRNIQELIDKNVSAYAIQEAAVQEGMITLAMDGKRKALAGLTTVEEVIRVLGMDLEV